MSKIEAIGRYNHIITKLRKAPSTLIEIQDYLKDMSALEERDYIVGKRTLERDKNDIRSWYNIDIVYDRSLRKYKIKEEEIETSDRLLQAFNTFNVLKLSNSLSDYIHFETRTPKGTKHLYGILHCIKNSYQIQFKHQKFWEDEITDRTLEPYALKESKHRWYLVGKDLKGGVIKNFALDRIIEIEITKSKFSYPKDFNVNEYYKYTFGILGADNKPEEIILSFSEFQGRYIKTLPMHSTQEVLIDNNEECRIKLKIVPSYDFIMELLSFGEEVRVIQPESLINIINKKLQNVINRYKID